MSTAISMIPFESTAAAIALDARDLVDCLSALQVELVGLADIADERLAAIRRADSAALHACAAREVERLREVGEVEQKRAATLARLAQQLRQPELRQARLSDVADAVPEPFSSQIRARNVGLRAATENLREKNRLASAVARDLQSQIRSIMAELAQLNRDRVVYGAKGRHEQCDSRSWVDALG